ncbi:MAG TPA: Wzz/FepE/Etk N-terminal domain-containing protein [Chitinophagaceae bacterium]|nr:Wzz/FepE/Etk N-terminal domain-containing protein [Chitinophagaceae bacterium]
MKQNMQMSDILQIVWKHRFKIILFTLISAGIGALLTFILPKQYDSNSYFIVRPPAYNMRSSTFGTDYVREVVYDNFATEKEIDVVDGIINSSFFIDKITRMINENLSSYNLENSVTSSQVKKSLKFKRSAQKVQNIRIRNANRLYSEKLNSLLLQELNKEYNKFFVDAFWQKKDLIERQLSESKIKLNLLDEEIEEFRKKHNLTSELAPQRKNSIISASNQSVKEGTETLYNMVESKEELLQNIKYLERSALEYATMGQEEHLDMIYVIAPGYVPNHATFPKLNFMVLIAGVIGFCLSTLGIIISYIPKQ